MQILRVKRAAILAACAVYTGFDGHVTFDPEWGYVQANAESMGIECNNAVVLVAGDASPFAISHKTAQAMVLPTVQEFVEIMDAGEYLSICGNPVPTSAIVREIPPFPFHFLDYSAMIVSPSDFKLSQHSRLSVIEYKLGVPNEDCGSAHIKQHGEHVGFVQLPGAIVFMQPIKRG